MDKSTEPGDIPAWQAKIQSLDMIGRARLALALGYSPATINNWAQGRNRPRAVTIRLIERKMGMTHG